MSQQAQETVVVSDISSITVTRLPDGTMEYRITPTALRELCRAGRNPSLTIKGVQAPYDVTSIVQAIVDNPAWPEVLADADEEDDSDLLKEAVGLLRWLADCEIPEVSPPLPDTDIARYSFTMGEIRAARAFLSKVEERGHD